MPYIVPSSPDTLADQRLYTSSRLVETSCLDCRAQVMVRKNSQHHTSIQWTQEAVDHCTTFAQLARAEGGRAIHAGCPRLIASIEAAVAEGTVPVGSDDD